MKIIKLEDRLIAEEEKAAKIPMKMRELVPQIFEGVPENAYLIDVRHGPHSIEALWEYPDGTKHLRVQKR